MVRLALPSEGGLQGESRCCWLWARIMSPPHTPCPLGVTICLADAPPRPLGLPRSPSWDREPVPRHRSHILSPGLEAVAGREVPQGRRLQARGVPGGGGGGRREPGIPGEPGVMRRSPLLREAGLPPSPLPPLPGGPSGARVLSLGRGAGPSRAIAVGEGGGEAQGAGPRVCEVGRQCGGGGGSLV